MGLCCLPLLGCPQPRSRPAADRVADKAALFGDPALVPTREGEHARREIASAQELRAALELLHAVERARVTVDLSDRGTVESAVVVVRARSERDREPLRAQTRDLAVAMLGDSLGDGLRVEISAPDHATPLPENPQRGPRLPLLLAVLGLGFSLGVSFDRSRKVWRRYAARRGLNASRTRGA